MSYIDDEELKIGINIDEEDDDIDGGIDEGLNNPTDDSLLDDDLLTSGLSGLDGSEY